jgi:hypothetical protein
LLTGAAMAAGLLLAGTLGLFTLMGDCPAVTSDDASLQQCEIAKRNAVFAFLALAFGLWLAGLAQALRGRQFAKRLALLSGPVAYVAANALF